MLCLTSGTKLAFADSDGTVVVRSGTFKPANDAWTGANSIIISGVSSGEEELSGLRWGSGIDAPAESTSKEEPAVFHNDGVIAGVAADSTEYTHAESWGAAEQRERGSDEQRDEGEVEKNQDGSRGETSDDVDDGDRGDDGVEWLMATTALRRAMAYFMDVEGGGRSRGYSNASTKVGAAGPTASTTLCALARAHGTRDSSGRLLGNTPRWRQC